MTIREVNTTTGVIAVTDQYGTPLQISLHTFDPLLAIPDGNEVWVIERLGSDWFLFKKMETGNEQTPLSALKPGDRRIESSGILYLNANDVRINGKRPSVITATSSRPAASAIGQGAQIFDTVLKKPLWSDGTNWRDATGTIV